MAKAKKDSELKSKSEATTAAAKSAAKPITKKKPEVATPAPKPAAAKAKPQPARPATHSGTPMIDTSLAAESAAKLLAAGINRKNKPQSAPARPESALFKQMKSGLNKPSAGAMGNLLDKTHGPASNKGGHGFNKQVGHNQTIGSDATRTGVPRRTGG